MSSTAIWNTLKTAGWALGLVLLLSGSILFFGNVPVLVFCLGAGVVLVGGWLAVRGIAQKASLPRVSLGLPLLVFLVGALLSALFSPAPRMGLERIAWFVFLSMLFYCLLDLGEQPLFRARLRSTLLYLTGPFLLAALLETYALYLSWWGQVGSQNISPPYPFRFNSLIVHSNIFMGLVNLCAPLALMMFLSAKSRPGRVLAAFWIVLYAAALPFASSRGGWVGTAVWIMVLTGLWLLEGGRWRRYLNSLRPVARRYWFELLPAALALLAASGYAALRFYLTFAGSHPTHAAGLNLNREHIWNIATAVWQASPWTGSGLGRLGLAYLQTGKQFPAGWWPSHAHSVPLQILAETGLVGFLPFLALTLAGAFLLIRSFEKTQPGERLWSAAALAGLSGFFVHGIFEEFTSLPFIVLAAVVVVALVISAAGPLPRFRQVKLTALAMPALLVASIGGFSLWANAPLYTASKPEGNTHWQQAAETAEQSALRDPAMSFYQNQAGLGWAMAWQQTGSQQALEQARLRMARGMELEPSNSIYWADLAVLSWYAGQPEEALQAIQQAIDLCQNESSYALNYGWILEQLGQGESAVVQYRRALELAPGTAAHPFWQSSPLRQAAAAEVKIPATASPPSWQQAREQISAGDFAAARLSLALSGLNGEPAAAIAISQAQFETSQGHPDAARDRLVGMVAAVEYSYWGVLGGKDSYNLYFNRRGFPNSVVPGYLRVSEDYGQYKALEDLQKAQAAAGDCQGAAATWEILQRELHAGELPKGGYPPPPVCSD